MATPTPKSILILGHGVFGLSTAHALSLRPSFANTTITLIDRSPFPSPDGSSIDSSRIIRADYHDAAYAKLAAVAQDIWRQQGPDDLGGQGRYTENGLVLVANKGQQGEEYVRHSLENVADMAKKSGDEKSVRELKSSTEIEEAHGSGGGSGDWGYINTRSGWADAEAGMLWLRKKVEALGRVNFRQGEVASLVKDGKRVTGAKLTSGEVVSAELVVVATGAWTGKLVDLRGRAQATGQVLCYVEITAEEQERLGNRPVLLNMSTGMFVIPPANRILKVARHSYGLANPTQIQNPENPSETITVSLPKTTHDDPKLWVPIEGEIACRQALREMVPSLAERPFIQSKICWYTDTPKGDFIITYHPDYEGLFLATGGSGHGYKFLPVIGDRIVDCVEGKCPSEFKEKWAWPKDSVDVVVTLDGSRGGKPGLILEQELRKGSKL
ncbi:FAD dependent oxidoreductase [Drepanopeziza brunnea f. sp. 'multigermtubi' MB_m1]|uniref:FAD dependent oxidoreductase n=1 Tax=Marssonina brunnea f. sp. multigermtubi (strain MB_m1) TaxID=1072389 RepID=K1WS25_MARBU|nr:FAD dependent oxidoreductase [Drepanopeziza brunnea f. sp. 'multigermtubi' MB_m1]EKD15851.1 FAD dependent oxidoreductase [Drepanopeziza brunnea f. sp. 'multigermtubi' MB_m1]